MSKTETATNIITQRVDFVMLFDVRDGNPNGDPDAGNRPRMDPETGHGLVSNVALKRKIRDYVTLAKEAEPGFEIYQTHGAMLNDQHKRGYDALGKKPAKKPAKDDRDAVTKWMCETFFDVRAFGAVMANEVNAGAVRGPVQVDFARSVEPVLPLEMTITRGTVTNEKDAKAGKESTMGSKHILPYGLYRVHGYINAPLAGKSGFTKEDEELLFLALRDMFDLDRSATRGEMAARDLIVFRHDSKLGNAQAHKLFERVRVRRAFEGGAAEIGSPEAATLPPARAYSDYVVDVEADDLPEGVRIERPFLQ